MELKKDNYLLVEIFGEEYKLVSKNQEKDYILKIVKLINEKMDLLSKNFPEYSKTKIAILVALNLTDEIFKNIQEKERNLKKIQQLTELIGQLLANNTDFS